MKRLIAIAILSTVFAVPTQVFAEEDTISEINGPAQVEPTPPPETPEQRQWYDAVMDISLRDGVSLTEANNRLVNFLNWYAAVEVIVARDGISWEQASHNLARFLAKLAQPDPPPTGQGLVQRWRSTALAAGWTAEQWPWVACIINRESGGNPNARSPSNDSGLMQINDVNVGHLRKAGIINSRWDLFDPYTNLVAAKNLYNLSGTGPWRATRSKC